MEKRIEEYKEFLAKREEETKQEVARLVSDDRGDDARFLRAKANIYDIFKSLCDASFKQAAGNEKDFITMFHQKATAIPARWEEALKKAEANEDAEKVAMEESKISAAKECAGKFEELFQ